MLTPVAFDDGEATALTVSFLFLKYMNIINRMPTTVTPRIALVIPINTFLRLRSSSSCSECILFVTISVVCDVVVLVEVDAAVVVVVVDVVDVDVEVEDVVEVETGIELVSS